MLAKEDFISPTRLSAMASAWARGSVHQSPPAVWPRAARPARRRSRAPGPVGDQHFHRRAAGDRDLINDNYSCRLPRTRSAGSWTHRESCETARFPCGGRVDHGCPGAAIARETDVGEDVGGGRGGGRDERADGATLAERRVAVDGEGASDVADAGGPVRRPASS